MQLRALAERILYATRIEDKLVDLAGWRDDAPGPATGAPKLPGRPPSLALDVQRERVAFPGVHELDQAGTRGRVLHFFANHELLAVELMALALLRFPEAPAAFRAGLVRTIEEEQAHLRLYLDRMAQDGVTLGEIPVSSFFWDALSSMDHPMDFVVGMSLTFEQANLDYARYYADAFAQAGDRDSAAVLDRIHREEIGHVKHGHAWFQRWRDRSMSDFDAYRAALPPLLAPSRARGKVFDLEGRRQAGLSEAFIRAVEVAGDSRGRPPGLWWFNPTCEHAWLHGGGHPVSRAARALVEDLETLPAFLAATDDAVLVRQEPRPDFLRVWAATAGGQPGFCVYDPSTGSAGARQPRHVSTFQPWGWCPDALRAVRPFLSRWVSDPPQHADLVRAAGRVNRKSWAAELRHALLEEEAGPGVSPTAGAGASVNTLSQAMALVDGWLARGVGCVLKADYGASGRQHCRVFSAADRQIALAWVGNALSVQPALVVEPWFERVADLSWVGRVEAGGALRVEGVTRFLCDERGQYRGAVVGRAWFGLPSEVVRFCHGQGEDARFANRLLERAALRSARRLAEEGYGGPFGVDAFVHRCADGLALRPLVEVNARWTMSHVASALRRRLAGGVNALWLHLPIRDIEDPPTFVERLEQALPPVVLGDRPTARLASGAFFTNDPLRAQHLFTVLLVGKDAGWLTSQLAAVGGPRLRPMLEQLALPRP